VKYLFLIRLGLDFTAAGLLLVALAYYWLDNAVHEVIGTGFFLLLIAHNFFNRRWWGGVARQRREPRNAITTAMNLSLLITMLVLLATSVIISQTVFSFLPIRSEGTSRQMHAAAAYWALVIVAVHLGWHWHKIAAIVSNKLGMTTKNAIRSFLLHGLAITIAVYGLHSCFTVNIGSKLFLQMTLDLWDFETSTPTFFVHHLSIVGMCAFLAHHTMNWIQVSNKAGL
jgi:hypothetical protein